MPVKKQSAQTSTPGVEGTTKPAKKTTAAAKPAGAKKTTQKSAATATAAATHKAPARRAAAKKPAAPVFDVEMHRAEIEHEAYLMWINRGHEHGQAHEDWLAAIELVKARHQG